MTSIPQIHIETERLLLRRPKWEDAERIAALLSDYEVAKYLTPVPHPYSIADARAWRKHPIETNQPSLVFLVEHPEHGVIGNVSIEAELGYWIGKPYWGKGYCSEAVLGLLNFYFETFDLPLRSGVHIDNPRSLAIQKRFGFETLGMESCFARARKTTVERFVTRLTKSDYMRSLAD